MGILLAAVSFVLFACFQAQHIPSGDSGDLVTAARTFGVAHPPGYPLYTFIGWIFSHIPFSTVVWRVGLLSSMPHALVIFLVYRIVERITKSRTAASIAGILLAGNYLFFLYSVTPEVFAPLDLFVVGLTYILLEFTRTRKPAYWYLLCFTAGLSLTHHHMVVFLFPALTYLIWRNKKYIVSSISAIRSVVFFAVGLVPYAYVPIAARGRSIINWDYAVNIHNFIQLITRADYGTFQSGIIFGVVPIQRLLEIKMWGESVLIDFSLVAVVFMISGVYFLWIHKKELFWFFAAAIIFLGPVFFFYASFPLQNRFTIATFERFLLPSYSLLAIMAGIGFSYAMHEVKKIQSSMTKKNIHLDLAVTVLVFVVLLGGCGITIWRFIGYPQDKTAEFLGVDILDGLPPGAVVLLESDTALFTTQFVRYGLGVRPDVYVLHGPRVTNSDYRKELRIIFPDLALPKADDAKAFEQFLENLGQRGLLFSESEYSVGAGWYWIPHGLVYQLTPSDKVPIMLDVKTNNIHIWNSLHNPTTGILARYNHLMLSAVRDTYMNQRLYFGKILMRAGDYQGGLTEIKDAISYGGDTVLSESYIYAGISEVALSECHAAIDDFESAKRTAFSPNNTIINYEALTYQNCLHDAGRAKPLFDEYRAMQQRNQTPLKQL